MGERILYAGDTSLQTAAAYLAGLMAAWGWPHDYLPSEEAFGDRGVDGYGLFIFSDYPAAMIGADAQRRVVEAVRRGAGLVMLGGWESFTGSAGRWGGTPIGDVLPVTMREADDRVNCDTPALIARTGIEHAATGGLPWDERPPVIGGYNRFTPKPAAATLLDVRHFDARRAGDNFTFAPTRRDPLLVVGEHGDGRTAALATDVAPHWVGPMVDWGSPRVTAEAPGSFAIEVGCHYAQFFRQLLAWARPPVSPATGENR